MLQVSSISNLQYFKREAISVTNVIYLPDVLWFGGVTNLNSFVFLTFNSFKPLLKIVISTLKYNLF